MEVPEVLAYVGFDLLRHFVCDSQRIVTHQVFDLDKVDKVLEELRFGRKLRLFQDVILISRKKFSNHLFKGFDKDKRKKAFPEGLHLMTGSGQKLVADALLRYVSNSMGESPPSSRHPSGTSG